MHFSHAKPRALLIVLDSLGCADTLGHMLERHPKLWLRHLNHESWSAILHPQSPGKDTTTGQWELMGAVLAEPFATFERFPDESMRELENARGTPLLGNHAASGTQILEELGAQSVAPNAPIV